MARVLIPVTLRTLSGGEPELEASGHNLRSVIANLGEQYPELAARLAQGGRIGRGLTLAINGDVVSTGLVTPVPEDAEIAIVPQISGGVSCSGRRAERGDARWPSKT